MYDYRKYLALRFWRAALVALLIGVLIAAINGVYWVDGLSAGYRVARAGDGGSGSGSKAAPSIVQGPALGAHTLLWQGYAAGKSPAVTPPVNTQVKGSSLLVFNGGYASNSNGPTDNKSNIYTRVGNAVVFNGYDGQFNAVAYVSLAANGGPGHQISIVKNGVADGEISIPFVEIKNAGVLHSVVQNYPASGPVVTSGDVTTTGPATLVAVWWGDATVYQMTAVPNNGFTIIDSLLDLPPNSAVQCAVAAKSVAAAGTYNVSWTESPNQGAILWLFAFQSDLIFANGFE